MKQPPGKLTLLSCSRPTLGIGFSGNRNPGTSLSSSVEKGSKDPVPGAVEPGRCQVVTALSVVWLFLSVLMPCITCQSCARSGTELPPCRSPLSQVVNSSALGFKTWTAGAWLGGYVGKTDSLVGTTEADSSGGLQGGLQCDVPPRPRSHCSPAPILCLQKILW